MHSFAFSSFRLRTTIQPLLLAAVYGNVECLKRLLEIGEEGKKKTTEHSTGQRRASPSVDGQKRREGVNIETTDSSGHTALLRAAMNGHVECVKALIEHSANIDAEHPETGDTSLILAAQNGKLDCVQLLLYHGASAAHKNNKGETAIHVASYWGHKPCVNLILTCMELPQLYDRR